MEVRLANANDIDGLHVLNELFENITTKELMAQCMGENKDEIICVAVDNGEVVGFCTGLMIRSVCYKDRRLDVEALFVKDACRCQGIGRNLLTCLEREAVRRGVFHFHILTGQSNKNARQFYAAKGYTKSGEILLEKTIKADSHA